MKAVFLIANQAWVVVFGSDIIPIQGTRFFYSIKDLQEALKKSRLELKKDNSIRAV